VLIGKFIAISAYIKISEKSQVNNLMMHLKLLGKQDQDKPKSSTWKEITKFRADIIKMETKKI
jgi:hypothetical protein